MNDIPRVLIVDLSRRFGGASARALGLLEGLPRGTTALACLDGSPVHRHADERGLPLRVVGSRKADPRITGRLVTIARSEGIGILDTQNPQSKLWSALAARRAGTALVSTLNSWYSREFRDSIRGRLYQTIERWSTAGTDLFVAVSREIRTELIGAGIPSDAIAVIPNAVRVDPATVPPDGDHLLERLGLPRGVPVVTAVGRLAEAKGHAFLVDAVAALVDPPVHAVIVGDGPLRRGLEERIARRRLAGRVHLAGERSPSEVLRIVLASDVFVMPSLTEGTPIALLEAAALAKPIVASRVGGIPDLVEDGRHARLVPPGDLAVLTAAIRDLLIDRATATRTGHAAREHVAERHGLSAQVAATLDAYERARRRWRARVGPHRP